MGYNILHHPRLLRNRQPGDSFVESPARALEYQHSTRCGTKAMVMLDWLSVQRWPWSPAWFQAWQHRRRIAYLQRTQIPAILAAQADGVGITEGWAPPGTPAEEILHWCEEYIRAAPCPAQASVAQLRVMLVRCTADEWDAAEASEGAVQLPAERHLATWNGHRSHWWWDGRDYIAAAIPISHDGLYIAVNTVGAAFLAALQPRYQQVRR